tara:strand:- start:1020 stop:1433 length:414 start_codon:yes stop_codon:yes gene_type:complete
MNIKNIANNKRIMTPFNPRWEEFQDRLLGAEGCRVHDKPNGKVSMTCNGWNGKSKAKVILQSMEGIDVMGSLDFFEQHAGFCDCEILFNVENIFELELLGLNTAEYFVTAHNLESMCLECYCKLVKRGVGGRNEWTH